MLTGSPMASQSRAYADSGLQPRRRRREMATILVVGPEDRHRERLLAELRRLSPAITVAPDGLFALTLLERARPDAVVVSTDLPDMDVAEFCRIVRKDPDLRQVRLAVIGSRQLRGDLEFLCDVYVETELPPPVAASFLFLDDGQREDADRASRPRLVTLPRGQLPAQELESLQGDLRVLNLTDLTQVLCTARKTGRLHLSCPEGPADIYFFDGQVIHASHLGYEGRQAFRWILTSTLAHPDVTFRFENLTREEAFRCPRTVNMTAQKLLLTIAVEIDESAMPNRGG